MELLVRHGKRLFLRTNGTSENACITQLAQRLSEEGIISGLRPVFAKLSSARKALALREAANEAQVGAPGTRRAAAAEKNAEKAEAAAAKAAAVLASQWNPAGGGGGAAEEAAPDAANCVLGRRHSKPFNDPLRGLAQHPAFIAAWALVSPHEPFVAAKATSYSNATLTLPNSRHDVSTTTVKHSKSFGVLGRDVVLLKRQDGSIPAKALSKFDPSRARIATPLAFFSYGEEQRAFMAVQLHCPAVYRWDEYTFLKPMELATSPGSCVVLPLSQMYDRLRPLPHFPHKAKVPSRTTVHVTVGFK